MRGSFYLEMHSHSIFTIFVKEPVQTSNVIGYNLIKVSIQIRNSGLSFAVLPIAGLDESVRQ